MIIDYVKAQSAKLIDLCHFYRIAKAYFAAMKMFLVIYKINPVLFSHHSTETGW